MDKLLPVLYHQHHRKERTDLPFWEGLARKQEGPLLELGCGTGRVLLHLARQGLPVFGLDHSYQMLAFLLEKAGIFHPPVFQADMAAFHLDKLFGLILLPCNTYSTLTSEQRQAALECVKTHLRRGGVFAASLPNPAVLRQMPAVGEAEVEDHFFLPEGETPVQVSSAWEREEDIFQVTWHYDLLADNGNVKRYSIISRHYLNELSMYQKEMEAAGLESVQAFGSFSRSHYHGSSPYLILVASNK